MISVSRTDKIKINLYQSDERLCDTKDVHMISTYKRVCDTQRRRLLLRDLLTYLHRCDTWWWWRQQQQQQQRNDLRGLQKHLAFNLKIRTKVICTKTKNCVVQRGRQEVEGFLQTPDLNPIEPANKHLHSYTYLRTI